MPSRRLRASTPNDATSPTEIASPDVSLTRRKLAERLQALAWVSAATSPYLWTLATLREWPPAVAWAWLSAAPVALITSAVLLRWRRGEGSVRCDDDGVTVRIGAWRNTFSREAVLEARVEPRDDGCVVELPRRDGAVLRVATESITAAYAWLDASDLAPHRRVSRIVLGAPWHRVAYAVGYGIVGVLAAPVFATPFFWILGRLVDPGSPAFGITLVVVWALFTWLTTAHSSPPRVDVGADGVLVRAGLSKRFIPYASLRRVTAGNNALTLEHGRHPLLLRATTSDGRALAQAVAAITHGLARWKAATPTQDLGLLERNGRTVTAWREAVSALLTPRGAFRSGALDRNAVERVLEDPTASNERRVGAALALVAASDDGRTRVRAVVDANANDALNDALLAAAEGRLDEAALTKVTPARRS